MNGGQAHHHHFQHFSHQHPLKLSSHPSHVASLCAGCKLICAGSGSIYTCSSTSTGCNYFLHTSCAQMPQQITHPFDHQNHVLTLLPIPAYPGGMFRCNACWKDGSGFSYHCGPCDIDLHMNCASMPLALPPHHQFHHPHQLNLTFSIQPGTPNSFICDVCNMAGHTEWLYWCVHCDFTAHLGCARSKPRPSIPVMPNYAPPTTTYASSRQPANAVVGRNNNGFTNRNSGQQVSDLIIQSLLGGVGGGGGGGGSSFSNLFGGNSGFQGNGLDQTVTPDLFGSGDSSGIVGGFGDLSNLNFFG